MPVSMQKVAELAGVSTSTVSRVVNEYPRVAASTVESVRRAMKEISFTPAVRRNGNAKRNARGVRSANICFLVFGTEHSQAAPAFQMLLRGVSGSCTEQDMNLIFSIVHDPSELPPKIEQRRVDG